MTRSTRAAQVPGAPAPDAAQPDTAGAGANAANGEGTTAPSSEETAEVRREITDGGRKLRASDVDPTKIKRAVLTEDGWVCPATLPVPPKA